MSHKWITLIYLICGIMNILQIHEICEEYLRYETTTTVQIELPEEIEFPSLTLCVDIPAILKWEEMPDEFLKRLFNQDHSLRQFHQEWNASKAQDFVKNTSRIHSSIYGLPDPDYGYAMRYLYNDLANEMTIPEIFNMTHPIEEIFHVFELNGLVMNPNGSIKFYTMLMSNMSNFQFSIDKTFLQEGLKCFSLSLRSGRNNIIYLNDVLNLTPDYSYLVFWQVNYGIQVQIFLHKKGYLLSLIDDHYKGDFGNLIGWQFVTYESVRLEYPYKTNCRDYTKVGLSSQKECIEKCFKMKSVKKFGYVFSESHAFPADDLHLGIQGDPNHTRDIHQECQLECHLIECHSIKYYCQEIKRGGLVDLFGQNCSKSTGPICTEGEVDYRQQSMVVIYPPNIPVTRTESQPAIPLIPFLTGVFSTFGFWLGFSVSDSLHMAKKIWQKVQIARDKIRPRIRLAQGPAVNRRKLKILTDLQLADSLSRRRQRKIYPGM